MVSKTKTILSKNAYIALPLAVLLILPLIQMDIIGFILNLMIGVFMYICLAESWNILAGFCGLLSMGHCAYFGLGAYIMIMSVQLNSNIWWGLVLGIVFNVILAFVVGAISVRVKDIFFAMITLALSQILYTLTMQWVEVTRGPRGLIMPPVFMLSREVLYYVALALAVSSIITLYFIRKSRMGTMFIALRENEELARSLGVDATKWKIAASVIGAVMASVIGSFYAIYIRSVQPSAVFTFNVTMKIMIVTFVGGKGTVRGPVYGAVIIIIDELIRGWLGGTYAGLPGIIYGLILALVIFFKPDGLFSIFHSKSKLPKTVSN
jgi:branched-chain amino acid transport system permease protein